VLLERPPAAEAHPDVRPVLDGRRLSNARLPREAGARAVVRARMPCRPRGAARWRRALPQTALSGTPLASSTRRLDQPPDARRVVVAASGAASSPVAGGGAAAGRFPPNGWRACSAAGSRTRPRHPRPRASPRRLASAAGRAGHAALLWSGGVGGASVVARSRPRRAAGAAAR
jgi:hypothetical protein